MMPSTACLSAELLFKYKAMKTQNKAVVFPLMLVILGGLKVAGQDQPNRVGEVVSDLPGTHNMLVVGNEAVFLSHLPMFTGLNKDKTDYTSLHRYQLILKVSFTRDGKDVSGVYTNDRKVNPKTKMYTLQPELFVLASLFTPDAQNPARSSFRAKVFSGHLERSGNREIEGLEDVVVNVKSVIHARKFDPAADKPDKLQYILFGEAGELLLAHMITKPPDFDQVVSVQVSGHSFTAEELNRGVSVIFPDRDNAAPQRLKEMQQARGEAQVAGADKGFDVQVQAGTEYYFEEGELAMPPIFAQTPEEAKSGF
jgi:hypothetical protein